MSSWVCVGSRFEWALPPTHTLTHICTRTSMLNLSTGSCIHACVMMSQHASEMPLSRGGR